MNTTANATTRVHGAPPIPTANPSGDATVANIGGANPTKPELSSTLLGRARAILRLDRSHT
jgi:hypothetical protein